MVAVWGGELAVTVGAFAFAWEGKNRVRWWFGGQNDLLMSLTMIICSELHVFTNAYVLYDLDFITHVGCLDWRVFVGVHWIDYWTLFLQKLLALSYKILWWSNEFVGLGILFHDIVSLEPLHILIIDSDSWLAACSRILAYATVVAEDRTVVSYAFLFPHCFVLLGVRVVHPEVTFLWLKL